MQILQKLLGYRPKEIQATCYEDKIDLHTLHRLVNNLKGGKNKKINVFLETFCDFHGQLLDWHNTTKSNTTGTKR